MLSPSLLTSGLALASVASASWSGLPKFGEKQFDQTFHDGYNLLKYMGSFAPYSNRAAYGVDRNTPEGCEIDQVHMLMRHGERYPDAIFGEEFVKVLDKMNSSVSTYAGDLAFMNEWTYYVDDAGLYAQESTTGPYAGLLDAFSRGSEYRQRYGHLWNGESVVPIFSSGYERVIETARYFGQGFFGYNYSTSAAINIIPEAASQGADSLTPSCSAGLEDYYTCYEDRFTATLPPLDAAAARFNAQNSGLNLTGSDVLLLMEMAAFELNVRAATPWAHAFKMDEWVAYEYIWDLAYYYCFGAGSNYQTAAGQVYANATRQLMESGPKEGKMFWSFTHDANITPVLAALGIVVPEHHLPNETIPFPSPYLVSDIVPMGGHLTLERMTCKATTVSKAGVYVRAILNEAVVPYSSCQSGPGYSCPLAKFSKIVDKAPKFDATCDTPSSYPQYLDFFWNYNTTTDYNYQSGPIGYAVTDIDT